MQITDKGIKRLEPGFILNLRKNIFLDKINIELSYKNLEEDILIKDEEIFNKLKEEERRLKAKNEQNQRIEEEIKKIKQIKKKMSENKEMPKSFIPKKISSNRIFHKQQEPNILEEWKDEEFWPNQKSLCPYDEMEI